MKPYVGQIVLFSVKPHNEALRVYPAIVTTTYKGDTVSGPVDLLECDLYAFGNSNVDGSREQRGFKRVQYSPTFEDNHWTHLQSGA